MFRAKLALLSLSLVPLLTDVITVAPGSSLLDASRVRETTDTTSMYFSKDGPNAPARCRWSPPGASRGTASPCSSITSS